MKRRGLANIKSLVDEPAAQFMPKVRFQSGYTGVNLLAFKQLLVCITEKLWAPFKSQLPALEKGAMRG